jgi:hypothetical protein
MKQLVVVILTAFLALITQSTLAQKPAIVMGDEQGWQKIGETVASFKSQDESIVVIGADEFSAIKLKVEDAPLHIERLQVFYESGEMEEIDVKKEIQPGEESDVFQLENPKRDIQKVAFTYNTVPNSEGEKADVQLHGLKADSGDKSSEAYREAEHAGENLEQADENLEEEAEEADAELERESEEAEENIEQRTERTESDIERAAENTGDAISEAAAKAAAEIDDKRHDTKVGPDGQTIYISDDSRFYYVDDAGKRVYVSEMELKDKPEKD